MTVLVVGAVVTVGTGGLAGPVVATGINAGIAAGGGVGVGAGLAGASAGSAALASGAAGAMAGAAGAGAGSSAVIGALSGAVSGTASGTAIAAAFTGPVGWAILGAAENNCSESPYTFDCWKQIVHDKTTEPSQGMFLKDIAIDDKVKSVTQLIENDELFLIFENIWEEKFRVNFMYLLPTNKLAAHAIKL